MFLETPRFPACPSFGFTSEPMYSVTHIETASGDEQSNENWEQALHRHTTGLGPRVIEEIAAALEFYHAVGGTAHRFRFKDYADYKSCFVNLTAAATDQPIAIVGGVKQLVKVYEAGVLSKQRLIQKPVQGTILVAENGVTKTEGADYTIDYATGIVTSALGGILTWGGEFDVPARFDSEFPVSVVNLNIHDCSVTIKETRDIA